MTELPPDLAYIATLLEPFEERVDTILAGLRDESSRDVDPTLMRAGMIHKLRATVQAQDGTIPPRVNDLINLVVVAVTRLARSIEEPK